MSNETNVTPMATPAADVQQAPRPRTRGRLKHVGFGYIHAEHGMKRRVATVTSLCPAADAERFVALWNAAEEQAHDMAPTPAPEGERENRATLLGEVVVSNERRKTFWLVELDGLTFGYAQGGATIVTRALNDPLAERWTTETDAIKWGHVLEARAPWMKGSWKATEHVLIENGFAASPVNEVQSSEANNPVVFWTGFDRNQSRKQNKANAAYIAYANPERVLRLVAELRKVREELEAAQGRAEKAEVQLAGCGVAAEGWGISMDNGPAKQGDYGWSPAYESVMKLRYKSWRCFHCDFFTLDPKEAAAHFGDRDDPDECKPLCKWWSRMNEGERASALQDTIQQLNDEREENSRLHDQLESERKARTEAEGKLRAMTSAIEDARETALIDAVNAIRNAATQPGPVVGEKVSFYLEASNIVNSMTKRFRDPIASQKEGA